VSETQPELYTSLAGWFHLLTRPQDYAEEAHYFGELIKSSADIPVKTVLELGSGGGNNASHLKQHFQLTLTDLSPPMLELSRTINPQCEHLQGDMRTLQLGRLFDAVFIHDAICYLTSLPDLRQAVETAFTHCRPGGVALFAPDFTRETFLAGTSHGGYDGDSRSLRYLEWTWDPEPSDDTYLTDFAYLLRDETGELNVISDRHVLGLFSRSQWLQTIAAAGFLPQSAPYPFNEISHGTPEVFVGVKPAS
jgi:SAM-dependent methyltransferase